MGDMVLLREDEDCASISPSPLAEETEKDSGVWNTSDEEAAMEEDEEENAEEENLEEETAEEESGPGELLEESDEEEKRIDQMTAAEGVKRMHKFEAVRPGPQGNSVAWRRYLVNALTEYDAAFGSSYVQNLIKEVAPGVLLNESYCGMCTGSYVGYEMHDEVCDLKRRTDPTKEHDVGAFQTYSGSDRCDTARRVTKALKEEYRPMHLFRNQQGRVDFRTRRELQQQADSIEEDCKAALHELRQKKKQMTGYAYKKERVKVVEEYELRQIAKVQEILDAVIWLDESYCEICNSRKCKLPKFNVLTELANGRLLIEIGGMDCTPHTKLGGNLRWASTITKDALSWARFVNQVQKPSIVILECSANTNLKPIDGELSNFLSLPLYTSPTAIGRKAGRERVMAVYASIADGWKRQVPRSLGFSTYLIIFAAVPIADATVYVDSSIVEEDLFKKSLARKYKTEFSSGMPLSDILPDWIQKNKFKYEDLIVAPNFADTVERIAFSNIAQFSKFGMPKDVFPALLKKGLLLAHIKKDHGDKDDGNEDEDDASSLLPAEAFETRLVTPFDYFNVMGFPLRGQLSERLPWPKVVLYGDEESKPSVDPLAWVQLFGNGMACDALASAFLMVFVAFRRDGQGAEA